MIIRHFSDPTGFWMKKRYILLFVVLLSNLMLPGFFRATTFSHYVNPIMSALIFAVGMLIVQRMKRMAYVVASIGILGVAFNWFEGYLQISGLLIFSIFIGIITYELFNDLVKKKSIEIPEIFGALSGYILIGYIGSLLFFVVNIYYDNAFTNIGHGSEGMQDLVYFSYITLLTIGYGEITPLIPASRNVAIVLGLIGQFYMVVVISTFVGKFLQNSNKK